MRDLDQTFIPGLRRRTWWLAAAGVAVVLGTIAVGVVVSHRGAERQVDRNLGARASTFAGFVSTFLTQQADRELETAHTLLAARRTSATRFGVIVSSFGSRAAVLLDRTGRLLQVTPPDPRLIGSEIASRYGHLTAAEEGRTAVSGVVSSAVRHRSIVAIAVPYQSAQGRRVLSVAYPVAQTALGALVRHATPFSTHRVMLLDARGAIIAEDPAQPGLTLSNADPALAAAISDHAIGSAPIDRTRATYAVARVPGTSWRFVIAIADSQLMAAIDGPDRWLPWVVFALLGVFGILALALFARSLTSSQRLAGLTRDLAQAARTDPVTGLLNRRALEEHLAHAVAYAHRHSEPVSALMIDLDHFKQINDTHGHDTGDQILKLIAESMRAVFRESDLYGRWGGDEFVALLPSTEHDGAVDVGQRLQAHVSAHCAIPPDVLAPSLSVGTATTTSASPGELLRRADFTLYNAKHNRSPDVVPTP